MAKLTLMWICKGGSVSTEVENLDDLDWVMEEMWKRGFTMWPGILPDYPDEEPERYKEVQKKQSFEEVDFCPVKGHGSTKKWADTKDGGHYCGHKIDGKWCGYAENEDGTMKRPPKSMPDYVQF